MLLFQPFIFRGQLISFREGYPQQMSPWCVYLQDSPQQKKCLFSMVHWMRVGDVGGATCCGKHHRITLAKTITTMEKSIHLSRCISYQNADFPNVMLVFFGAPKGSWVSVAALAPKKLHDLNGWVGFSSPWSTERGRFTWHGDVLSSWSWCWVPLTLWTMFP